MATDGSNVLSVYKFPTLARGYDISASPRSLIPNADSPSLFRSMNNLTSFRGILGSWYGIYQCSDFVGNLFTVSQNGGYWTTTPDGLLNGQTPVFLFADFPMSFPNSSTTSPTDFGSLLTICVTSREIHIYSPQDQTWYNATPVYTGESGAGTETVNVSGGGTVTVSTGTNSWATRKIAPGQLIQFSGDANWYSIATVSSGPDTLTLYNYSGGVKAGVTYSIRRCFGGREYSCGENLIYAQVFNGNLFLGGPFLGGATAGPAVIKVSNIYDNVYTTDYILAGFDLTGGMTADGQVIADLWDIKGLKVLQDGRVVIATSEVPSGRTGVVGNRIRYSSNDEAYQWVASPGGFTDLTEEGEVVALGQLDPNTITAHFHRSVWVGQFTGQDDPPLNFTKSSATVGTISAKSIANYGNMEVFLGSDGAIHGFDGSKSTRLCGEKLEIAHMGAGYRDNYRSAAMLMANTVGLLDVRRGHYRLFFNDNNGDFQPTARAQPTLVRCVCYILDLSDGALYREEYGTQITAATRPAVGFNSTTYQAAPVASGGDFGDVLVGMPSCLSDDTANSLYLGILSPYSQRPAFDMEEEPVTHLYAYASRYYNHNDTPWNETGISIGFETDDLDFDLPGVDKTLDHVILWVSKNASGAVPTDTVVQVSRDGGKNWIPSAPTFYAATQALGTESWDVPLAFYFAPYAGEKWRIRLRGTNLESQSTDFLGFHLHRMNVYYQTQGEIESVDPDITP